MEVMHSVDTREFTVGGFRFPLLGGVDASGNVPVGQGLREAWDRGVQERTAAR